MLIDINTRGKFTYINETTREKWPQWKIWEEMSEEEKNKVNLGIPSDKYIMLDKDLKNKSEIEIQNEWLATKQKLIENNISNYVADRSPQAFHVFIPFNQLDAFDESLAKEIRRIYIRRFDCDEAKVSMKGVISLPERPHFKNGKINDVIEITTGINELNPEIISEAKINLEHKTNQNFDKLIDKSFNKYFEEDPFFNYISSNILTEDCERNNVIFPNLAIAAVKSGKTKEEVENIIKPLIQKNFPGKSYKEFEGWLKKAASNEIETYNQIQINNWMKKYTKVQKDIYDLTPITVEEELNKLMETQKGPINLIHSRFISDRDLEEMPDEPVEWLVDQWIAKGDICFIAGKAGSYKSSFVAHLAYAVAYNKLVFNKYKVEQGNVLYINEENNKRLFRKLIKRIKKGLELESQRGEAVIFSIMENFRLENPEDIKALTDAIKKYNISLLILDSFRRFFVGKENDADVINKIFNTLKLVRKICDDITIIALHHAKKDDGNSWEADIRDILRGSSDIVNSADSVIGIKRKMRQTKFQIEHIKNRAGEEMSGKIVQIDGKLENKMYFYEIADVKEVENAKLKPEACADELLNLLETKKLYNFKRVDIKDLENKYTYDNITRALRILKKDGILTENSAGPHTSYIYQSTGAISSNNEVETNIETSDEIDVESD